MKRVETFFILFSLFAAASGNALADTAPQSGADENNCLWGKVGEKTTYLPAYCPAMAPEIPYGPTADQQAAMKRKLPMRPEDALTVVMSDGCTYRVYYREAVRMQAYAEYKWVFEPEERVEKVPVEEYNPYTGQIETRWVEERTRGDFPVFHEKEVITYEPQKILERVIIPGEPSGTSAGQTGNGSAELHFETDVH